MKKNLEFFSLIDGHAQFFRSYYAIRTPMTSPITGEPTAAVYGFTGTLLKLLKETNPKWLAVAIDVSGSKETFRNEIYPDYKAQRGETPEDFPSQVERCIELLKILGIPVYGKKGYEADDIISTIANLSCQLDASLKMKVISRDKDLTQLINDRVEIWDLHTNKYVTPETVFKVNGIQPSQVVDVLSLVGDASDNIPGVPGIGPKTAGNLILEYKSIDSIYEAVDKNKITGKRAENLRAHYENVLRNKKLIKLVDDINLEFNLEESRHTISKINFNKLRNFCKELGFNRFYENFLNLKEDTVLKIHKSAENKNENIHNLFDDKKTKPTTKTKIVLNKEDLLLMVGELNDSKCFAFDTETTGLNPRKDSLCGISFSIKQGQAYYVPLVSNDTDCLDLKDIIQSVKLVFSSNNLKVAHNLKFDMQFLKKYKIDIAEPFADTMIASWVLDSSRFSHKLDDLSLSYLGRHTQPYEDLVGVGKKQISFDKVDLDKAAAYAGEDSEITFLLWKYLSEQLCKEPSLKKLYEEVELPLVMILGSMESLGIKVDPKILKSQQENLSLQFEELKKQILSESPHEFNPDSPRQLAQVLFGSKDDDLPGLGIKPRKKGKTGPSTSVEVLTQLAETESSSLPTLMLRYRRLSKLLGTYLQGLQEAIDSTDSRIHASFHITGTATGRLSSSNPNLQNIPIKTDEGREVRHAFVAPKNKILVAADYSQIELRMLAHLSKDKNLLEAFHNGKDIHRSVAANIFNIDLDNVTSAQRDGAKMVNFGIVYGITSWGLAKRLGSQFNQFQAQDIIDSYKYSYPGIQIFLDKCVTFAQEHKYVETILGRRRAIKGFQNKSTSRDRAFAERTAINSVVQGSAADLIKVAMLNVNNKLRQKKYGYLILQIHDELILEVQKEKANLAQKLLTDEMVLAMNLDVPLEVSASQGKSWYVLK